MGADGELPALGAGLLTPTPRPPRKRPARFPSLICAVAIGALLASHGAPAGASAAHRPAWSAPAQLEACPALEGARALFPSDGPNQRTGPGGVVWEASASCSGGAGPRVSRIAANDTPQSPSAPLSGGARVLGPRGALLAGVAPHGQILIAGAAGGLPVEGLAGSPFGDLAGANAAPTLAIASGYLGDAALATATPGAGVQLQVERFYARGLTRSAAVATNARSLHALTLAMDFRTDALAVWEQGGAIYARDIPAAGAEHPVQRLASGAAPLRIAALLSDNDRAIVAWSVQAGSETSVYLDRSGANVAFRAPTLIERFRDPAGLAPATASPRLIRLSSESVMMAWAAAAEGHWVVRTAAIDLQGIGAASTIAAPGGDALLSDLVPGPAGDALLLWTQPQPALGGPQTGEQAIFAARGFDVYPKRTIFGRPEEVTPAGPNSDPSAAIDPGTDTAIALWRGVGGALDYARRGDSSEP